MFSAFETPTHYHFNTLKEIQMKYAKTILLALMVVSVFALSACNTVQGVGKDVKKAGETIEKAGDKN